MNALRLALIAIPTMFFIAFLMINMILGCETWQQEYWTVHNSCWYPLMEEWTPPR